MMSWFPIRSKVFSIFAQKQCGLKTLSKVRFILEECDIEESFVKGSGPGGQKINKRSNRVRLVHTPTKIEVSCQDYRDITSNRKHARTMLRDKVDLHLNGAESKLGKKQDKIRKRKKKNASRTKKKYGDATVVTSSSPLSLNSGIVASSMSSSDVEMDTDSDEYDDDDEEEEEEGDITRPPIHDDDEGDDDGRDTISPNEDGIDDSNEEVEERRRRRRKQQYEDEEDEDDEEDEEEQYIRRKRDGSGPPPPDKEQFQ